jgi:hypothetical protein
MEGTGAGEERGNGSKLSCRRDASCVGFVLFTRHRSQRVCLPSVCVCAAACAGWNETPFACYGPECSYCDCVDLITEDQIRSDQIKSNQIKSNPFPLDSLLLVVAFTMLFYNRNLTVYFSFRLSHVRVKTI